MRQKPQSPSKIIRGAGIERITLDPLKKKLAGHRKRRKVRYIILESKILNAPLRILQVPGMTCLFRPMAAVFVYLVVSFNQIQSADTVPASRYRWPGGVIPYVIDANVPRPERIYSA